MKTLSLILSLSLVLTPLAWAVTDNGLSEKDELYRQKLVKLNSRPLSDGLLVDAATGFPFDNGYFKENDEADGVGTYTSPTNIGLYLTYLLGVYQGQIEPFYDFSKEKALARIEQILTELDTLPPEDKWEGLYYWMVYENGKWKRAADGRKNYVISQPDNGNLFGGFIAVLGGMELALKADPNLAEKSKVEHIQALAKKLIFAADWKKLMDPERELYYLAFIPDTNEPLRFGGDHVEGEKGAPIYVENLMDEWRLGVLIAYALSDAPGSRTQGVPITTWTQLDREKRAYDPGDGKLIEALGSGHGGMFQQRLPLIFVPEMEWSPAFRDNHAHFFYIAANYAQSKKQPFLMSASTNPEGKVEYVSLPDNPRFAVDTTYDEFGTKPLALKLDEEFNIIEKKKDGEVVGDTTAFYYASTPHALALGFLSNPVETIALFKKAELGVKVFCFPGGVPDSYGVSPGKPDRVVFRTLVLDQLLMLLALQGNSFHDDFEEGLKSLGVYEKAKKLYADEETFYPKVYPLRQDALPAVNTSGSFYVGAQPRDYATAIKLVRQLALDAGFPILTEESERILAEKVAQGKISRVQLKNFFGGNLLGLSVGENGTFKPRKIGSSLQIPRGGGWMGDRVPLVDLRNVKQLVLKLEPVSRKVAVTLELKGQRGEDIFPAKKYRIKLKPGQTTATIPLPDGHPQFLSYIVLADASDTISIKSLRLSQ